MEFESARPVEMRRFTPEEEARLNEKSELLDQLVIKAYEQFDIPKDHKLLEAENNEEAAPDATPSEVSC